MRESWLSYKHNMKINKKIQQTVLGIRHAETYQNFAIEVHHIAFEIAFRLDFLTPSSFNKRYTF